MIRNYLTLALRTLNRNFTYSAINIIGFSISLTCCFVIFLHVKTEVSFENFHENKDRIYRYIPKNLENGQLAMQTWTASGLAPLLANAFPQDIDKITRVSLWDDRPALKSDDHEIVIENLLLADSSFFEIFSFPVIRGNKSSILNRPLTMVISRKMADTNFPNQDPVGKVIRYQNKYDLEITGIFDDIPTNSHLQFSCVVSYLSLRDFTSGWYTGRDILSDFGSWNYMTYVMVNPHTNIVELEKSMSDKVYHHLTRGRERPKDDINDWLQPLNEIHFTKSIKGDGVTSDISYVYMAVSLGVIILLVACFNFMNLSTAMALRRSKEVGLRKSLGALRMQLIKQFLGEALLQVILSIFIALFLLQALLPLVGQLFGIKLVTVGLWQYIVLTLSFIFITTLMAGGYPAFYLSSFNPSKVLKGSVTGEGKQVLRKSLIVFQFSVSIFLLVCSMVVYYQLTFLQTKELGFSKERILTIFATSEVKASYETFKSKLLQYPQVTDVTISNQRPGNLQSYWRYEFPNKENDGNHAVTTLVIGENYLDFMDIKLKDGRKLSTQFPTDKDNAFIVNETFVREFGLRNPLETTLQVAGDTTRRGLIVGVVEDFYFQSLHKRISPIVMRMDDRNAWMISVKLSQNDLQEGISKIENEWKKFSLDSPFDYKFLDDHISENYLAEKQASSFLLTLTAFAILIAGLGLLGLTAFTTLSRRKEIGIRKILGSSINQIVMLFSKDILKLQLIAFIMAAPLAWIAAGKWLENFAYHIELSPIAILASGALVTVFSLLIIGFQSSRAARENPTESLRSE